MTDTVLVTYASRTGTTAGVAQAIGETLTQCGAVVKICPISEVNDVSPYRAVVAGSAIQNKQWLPEAMDWLRANRISLAQRPFAAFLVCMTLAMNNENWRNQAGVADWLGPVRAMVKPVSEGYFAGALDISRIPSPFDRLKFRISVWVGVWSEGDHRNWEAIRKWASDLAPQLGIQPTQR